MYDVDRRDFDLFFASRSRRDNYRNVDRGGHGGLPDYSPDYVILLR